MARAKKGKTSADRLEELFKSPIFCLLQSRLDNLKTKVHLIDADLADPNLGLSAADQDTLVRQVPWTVLQYRVQTAQQAAELYPP